MKEKIRPSRLVHLDMIRGVAALAVCADHLRNFQFVEYRSLATAPSLMDKAFYLVTGLGHQSVMIFFVLSGYFVGGSVLKDLAKKRWSWLEFGRRRLTRLYMVLIPALVLTLFWDQLGIAGTGGHGYDGAYEKLLHSGPTPWDPTHDDLMTFIGNSLFLQTVTFPVYGSNGPLWSLACEFWYYLSFPLAMLLLVPGRSWLSRGVCAALLAGCAYLVPLQIWEGGLVWLMGCLVFWITTRPALNAALSRWWICVAGGIAVAILMVLSKGTEMGTYDFWIGLAFTFMLPYLIKINTSSRPYERVATGLSDISYTLYVVHFPLLAYLFFTFRPGMQVNPSLAAYGQFALLVVVILVYASVLWWMFESRTDRVRKAIERWMHPGSP